MTKTKGVPLHYNSHYKAMICPICGNLYSISKKFKPKICGECYVKDRLKMKEAQNEEI